VRAPQQAACTGPRAHLLFESKRDSRSAPEQSRTHYIIECVRDWSGAVRLRERRPRPNLQRSLDRGRPPPFSRRMSNQGKFGSKRRNPVPSRNGNPVHRYGEATRWVLHHETAIFGHKNGLALASRINFTRRQGRSRIPPAPMRRRSTLVATAGKHAPERAVRTRAIGEKSPRL
jgi:hypothetical protein